MRDNVDDDTSFGSVTSGAGVIVILKTMFTTLKATSSLSAQYHRLVNPVSGAVALGTLLAAATLPVVVWMVAR